MRVYILVNVLSNVSSFVYSNHIEFFIKTVQNMINFEVTKVQQEILELSDKVFLYKDDLAHIKLREKVRSFTNIVNSKHLVFFTPPRMSIDMARNVAAREALKHECDYLMFIDDDVLIPPDTLSQLVECDADIAGGLVMIRGYPFNVMAFKKANAGDLPYFNDIPKITGPDGKEYLKNPVTQDDDLVGVGFSCALIKCDLLKKVNPPYFVSGPRSTEDVYFCLKAADCIKLRQRADPNEPNLKIALNTNIQCGHLLNSEPIEYRNRDIFKEFYEILDPAGTDHFKNPDGKGRDLDYIKRNTIQMK